MKGRGGGGERAEGGGGLLVNWGANESLQECQTNSAKADTCQFNEQLLRRAVCKRVFVCGGADTKQISPPAYPPQSYGSYGIKCLRHPVCNTRFCTGSKGSDYTCY